MSTATAALITASVLSASPTWTRWVVGIEHDDLRTTRAGPVVERLVKASAGVEVTRLPFALVIDVPGTRLDRARLRAMAEVRFVERDIEIPLRVRAPPDDPLFAEQWYLHDDASPLVAVHAEAAWAITHGLDAATNDPVRVAVIDEGFDLGHEDLRFASSGADLSAGPCASATEAPCDADASADADEAHGTWVAGVAAAQGFNARGVVGVCPACEVLPIRLLGDGGPLSLFTTNASTIAQAIVWAVDEGAAVINNSWGPPDGNPYEPFGVSEHWPMPDVVRDAVRYAATTGRGGLGTLVVWSAGNGSELATYDGFASHALGIAVGSVNASGLPAWFSDRGPPLFVVAPGMAPEGGLGISTTDLSGADSVAGDYFQDFGGTSASAPMVAGAIALVAAAYPELTGAQIREALALGADPIDSVHGEYTLGHSPWYGYGLLDVAGALAMAATLDDGSPCTDELEWCGNGVDDNCDGVADADDASCATCTPDQPSEACDGADNNCDGQADEMFACVFTDCPSCAPCTNDTQCEAGTECVAVTAFEGSWCLRPCAVPSDCGPAHTCHDGRCVPERDGAPFSCLLALRCTEAERCDGLDNDCDGAIDDLPECAPPKARSLGPARPGGGCRQTTGGLSILCLLLVFARGRAGRWRHSTVAAIEDYSPTR